MDNGTLSVEQTNKLRAELGLSLLPVSTFIAPADSVRPQRNENPATDDIKDDSGSAVGPRSYVPRLQLGETVTVNMGDCEVLAADTEDVLEDVRTRELDKWAGNSKRREALRLFKSSAGRIRGQDDSVAEGGSQMAIEANTLDDEFIRVARGAANGEEEAVAHPQGGGGGGGGGKFKKGQNKASTRSRTNFDWDEIFQPNNGDVEKERSTGGRVARAEPPANITTNTNIVVGDNARGDSDTGRRDQLQQKPPPPPLRVRCALEFPERGGEGMGDLDSELNQMRLRLQRMRSSPDAETLLQEYIGGDINGMKIDGDNMVREIGGVDEDKTTGGIIMDDTPPGGAPKMSATSQFVRRLQTPMELLEEKEAASSRRGVTSLSAQLAPGGNGFAGETEEGAIDVSMTALFGHAEQAMTGLAGTLRNLQALGTLKDSGGGTAALAAGGLPGGASGSPDDLKIGMVDAQGNALHPKDAFRLISYKFHGKLPGKKKLGKLLEKKIELKKHKRSSMLPTLKALRAQQRKTGEAFLVLSNTKREG